MPSLNGVGSVRNGRPRESSGCWSHCRGIGGAGGRGFGGCHDRGVHVGTWALGVGVFTPVARKSGWCRVSSARPVARFGKGHVRRAREGRDVSPDRPTERQQRRSKGGEEAARGLRRSDSEASAASECKAGGQRAAAIGVWARELKMRWASRRLGDGDAFVGAERWPRSQTAPYHDNHRPSTPQGAAAPTRAVVAKLHDGSDGSGGPARAKTQQGSTKV